MLHLDLERLIDRYSLAMVLGALAIIASERSRMLIASCAGQSSVASRAWSRISAKLADNASWCDRYLKS